MVITPRVVLVNSSARSGVGDQWLDLVSPLLVLGDVKQDVLTIGVAVQGAQKLHDYL